MKIIRVQMFQKSLVLHKNDFFSWSVKRLNNEHISESLKKVDWKAFSGTNVTFISFPSS